jgi:hypothetical protein
MIKLFKLASKYSDSGMGRDYASQVLLTTDEGFDRQQYVYTNGFFAVVCNVTTKETSTESRKVCIPLDGTAMAGNDYPQWKDAVEYSKLTMKETDDEALAATKIIESLGRYKVSNKTMINLDGECAEGSTKGTDLNAKYVKDILDTFPKYARVFMTKPEKSDDPVVFYAKNRIKTMVAYVVPMTKN